MLHRLFVVLLVVVSVLSLVSVVMFFGVSITGNTIKGLDESLTSISFIIIELLAFAFIVFVIDLIRFRKRLQT